MSNPYTGLTSNELQARRAYLLSVLNGTAMKSFGGQGSNYAREIPTLEEARQDLALVLDAINGLDPDTATITRTQGVHSTNQVK